MMKVKVLFLSSLLLLSGCSMNNTTKGGLIGGGGGAALGGLIGAIAGKGKGAAIGAAIGTAVGAGAGVLIGNRMDKAKKAAEAIESAQAEVLQDAQGVSYVKVTFDSGILFNTGSSALSTTAKNDLTKFATTVLGENQDMDVAIVGHTDNQGWKNSTAEQSRQKNQELSQQRAQAVNNFLTAALLQAGKSNKQIQSTTGMGEDSPVADNNTAEGRQQNRRVEIYLIPSKQMVETYNAQATK